MNCAATRKPTYSVNLDSTLRKVYLNDIFATGDCCANGVTLPMFKGNAPAVFGDGATVKGYFTRYGKKESVLLTGELNGHVASVELNKACYTKSGQFALVVKVYEGDVTSTIFYGEGSVLVADAGEYIDPDGIVPSLDDLLARIAEMEAATNAGKAATADAQAAAKEARQTAEDMQGQMDAHKADTAAALSAQKDTKADAIMDTSARAASHSLHAQDGRMHVTLYGQTVETGTGDKSPENPYAIGGVGYNKRITFADVDLMYSGANTAGDGTIVFVHCPTTLGGKIGQFTMPKFNPMNVQTWEELPPYHYKSPAYAGFNGEYIVTCIPGTHEDLESAEKWYADNLEYAECFLNVQGDGDGAHYAVIEIYGDNERNYIVTPLLPDGAPLHGNGTVNDTLENDVPSGFDEEITLNGTESWNMRNDAPVLGGTRIFQCMLTGLKYTSGTGASNRFPNAGAGSALWGNVNHEAFSMYCNDSDGAFIRVRSKSENVEEFKAELSANPLRIKYRSAAYTLDKDLRVCRTVRRCKTVVVTTVSDEHPSYPGLFTMVVQPNTYNASTPDDSCNIFNISDRGWSAIPDIHARFIRADDARFKWEAMAGNIDGVNAYLAEHPLEITLPLKNPEIYVTDAVEARKPSGIMPVTVTGSGETAVEYPHDTKHYIDSKVSELVTLALANQ